MILIACFIELHMSICVLGFLEKNRDTFSLDLLHVVQSSTFKFFTDLFTEDLSMVCTHYLWRVIKQILIICVIIIILQFLPEGHLLGHADTLSGKQEMC